MMFITRLLDFGLIFSENICILKTNSAILRAKVIKKIGGTEERLFFLVNF